MKSTAEIKLVLTDSIVNKLATDHLIAKEFSP